VKPRSGGRSHNSSVVEQQDQIAAQANLHSKLCWNHNPTAVNQQDQIAAKAHIGEADVSYA
jgi:hypothetical protein